MKFTKDLGYSLLPLKISLHWYRMLRIEDLHYDWEKNSGRPYDYFSFGAAASEVEIDCLTGDHRVIKTHIVMDVGDSLNPAIDVGQVCPLSFSVFTVTVESGILQISLRKP